MKVSEVEGIGKVIAKYVSYRGFNLWEISEAGIYNNFLANPRRRRLYEKVKDYASRSLVKWKEKGRERKVKLPNSKGNYLFLVYDVSHVKTFIPILKHIKNFRVIRQDSPISEITRKTLEVNNIPYNNLDSYATQELKEKLKSAAKEFSRKWAELKNNLQIKRALGERYYQVLDVLEYYMKSRKRFLEIVRAIELYENVFDQEKILKVIVSDDVNPIGRIACIMAKRRGIPSLVIQHGQLQGNPVGKITADRMAVNGYAERRLLISKGAEKSKIIVTGQPRFDSTHEKLKLDKKEICRELGIDPNKKTIVFTAQKPTQGENITKSALKCFLTEVEKVKEKYNFIITIREDWSRSELGSIPHYIKVIMGGDIQKILVCSDVLVTAFSTVAVEAVLLNKPVITINIGDKSYIDYGREGVGIRVLREEAFLPALDRVLYSNSFRSTFAKARKEFIRKYNYRLDGNATKRVLKIIKLRK